MLPKVGNVAARKQRGDEQERAEGEAQQAGQRVRRYRQEERCAKGEEDLVDYWSAAAAR